MDWASRQAVFVSVIGAALRFLLWEAQLAPDVCGARGTRRNRPYPFVAQL